MLMVSTLPAPPPPSTSITALNNLMRQWKRCCSLALMYRGYLDTHVWEIWGVMSTHSWRVFRHPGTSHSKRSVRRVFWSGWYTSGRAAKKDNGKIVVDVEDHLP